MWENVEKLLKKKGWKISDLQKATGIPYSTFTDWKAGRYTPKLDKLQKIADALGTTVTYILTGEEPDGYYYNPETAAIAKEIFENYELHALFDTARDSDPEDLKAIHDMLIVLKRKERKEND